MKLYIPMHTSQKQLQKILDNNPGVTELYCIGCTKLDYIPQLDNLIKFSCDLCINLTKISQLHNLVNLSCEHCVSLVEIPKLDKLKILCMNGCFKITKIPSLISLKYLKYDQHIKPYNMGYLPTSENKGEGKINHQYYKMRLLQASMHRKLGKVRYGAFIDDVVRLVEKLIIERP